MKLVSMRSLMIFLCVLPASASFGQTAKDEVHDLERAVLKQQRYMRGFSADSVVRWQWIDDKLMLLQPRARMLSAFIAQSVKLKGDKIVIEGKRSALFRKSDTELTLIPMNDDMEIDVDLQGADLVTEIPLLADLLFYSSREEALSKVPARLSKLLPPPLKPESLSAILKSQAKSNAPTGCDCAQLTGACADQQLGLGMKGTKPPKLIHSVDPAFSDEARRKKFSGNVQVSLTVDSTGHPANLWIIRPAGMGLDENASNAVSQYGFSPATCHGNPVAVDLSIDVNFTIF